MRSVAHCLHVVHIKSQNTALHAGYGQAHQLQHQHKPINNLWRDPSNEFAAGYRRIILQIPRGYVRMRWVSGVKGGINERPLAEANESGLWFSVGRRLEM